jgi:hypothetical protein
MNGDQRAVNSCPATPAKRSYPLWFWPPFPHSLYRTNVPSANRLYIDVTTTIDTYQWIVDRGFIHKPFNLDAVLQGVQRCLET